MAAEDTQHESKGARLAAASLVCSGTVRACTELEVDAFTHSRAAAV